MSAARQTRESIRQQGRITEALLIFLKQLTAHARWVFVALLLIYAASGIRTIQPQENALVRRLGHLQKDLHGPGLLIGLPRPFDEVLRFDTGRDVSLTLDQWAISGKKIADPDQPIQLSDEEMNRRRINRQTAGGSVYTEFVKPPGAALDPVADGYSITSDFNIIQGRFTVRYRIVDPFRFASVGENVTDLLRCLGYQALTHQLADRPIDASLTAERRDLPTAIVSDIQRHSDDFGLGVDITGFDINELSPPSQVLASFEDVTNARQFAKTMLENSRQYRAETLAKTSGDAGAIRHRAEAYARDTTESARGEAAAFNALLLRYLDQPVLVARRLLRESLDTALLKMNSRTLVPLDRSQPSLVLEPRPEFDR